MVSEPSYISEALFIVIVIQLELNNWYFYLVKFPKESSGSVLKQAAFQDLLYFFKLRHFFCRLLTVLVTICNQYVHLIFIRSLQNSN